MDPDVTDELLKSNRGDKESKHEDEEKETRLHSAAGVSGAGSGIIKLHMTELEAQS